jgi:hypothetical protein
VTPLETLRALGTGSEPPPQAKQRVEGALFASLAAATLTPLLAKPLAGARLAPAPTPLLAGAVSSKVLAVAAGIWLSGGITGAALYRVLRPQEIRLVYVDRKVAEAPPLPAKAADLAAVESEPSALPAPVALTATGSSTRAPSDGTNASAARRNGTELARERALLDVARADAARGEPAQALAQAERHRQQFPRGRLSEEREALAIRALSSLGRTDEAHARARAFRAAYPKSFLIPALESALSEP